MDGRSRPMQSSILPLPVFVKEIGLSPFVLLVGEETRLQVLVDFGQTTVSDALIAGRTFVGVDSLLRLVRPVRCQPAAHATNLADKAKHHQ